MGDREGELNLARVRFTWASAVSLFLRDLLDQLGLENLFAERRLAATKPSDNRFERFHSCHWARCEWTAGESRERRHARPRQGAAHANAFGSMAHAARRASSLVA
jgi:hypothetical protein